MSTVVRKVDVEEFFFTTGRPLTREEAVEEAVEGELLWPATMFSVLEVRWRSSAMSSRVHVEASLFVLLTTRWDIVVVVAAVTVEEPAQQVESVAMEAVFEAE